MADVQIDIQDAARSGTVLAYRTSTSNVGPLSDSDRFLIANSGNVVVLIKNGATSTTLRVEITQRVDGMPVTDRIVQIAENTDVVLGPFPPTIYNDSNGDMALWFSDVAHLSVAVIRS